MSCRAPPIINNHVVIIVALKLLLHCAVCILLCGSLLLCLCSPAQIAFVSIWFQCLPSKVLRNTQTDPTQLFSWQSCVLPCKLFYTQFDNHHSTFENCGLNGLRINLSTLFGNKLTILKRIWFIGVYDISGISTASSHIVSERQNFLNHNSDLLRFYWHTPTAKREQNRQTINSNGMDKCCKYRQPIEIGDWVTLENAFLANDAVNMQMIVAILGAMFQRPTN